jgi:hypothetical protein
LIVCDSVYSHNPFQEHVLHFHYHLEAKHTPIVEG